MIHITSFTFLSPLALLGLLACVIPVAIHFWSRRVGPPAWFPSIHFLNHLYQETKRRHRFNNLLLLILRLSVICLLVLAAARPVLNPDTKGSSQGLIGGKTHYFVIDDSASMNRQVDAMTLYHHAINEIRDKLATLNPTQDRVRIIFASSSANWFTPRSSSDFNGVSQALAKHEPAYRTSNMAMALKRVEEEIKTHQHASAHVHIYSDHTSIPMTAIETWIKAQQNTLISTNQISTQLFGAQLPKSNISINDVKITPHKLRLHQESNISISVTNHGQNRQSTKLLLKGLSSDLQFPITLGPGETVNKQLNFTPKSTGLLTLDLRLMLNDQDADATISDNRIVMPVTILDRSSGVVLQTLESVNQSFNEKIVLAFNAPSASSFNARLHTSEADLPHESFYIIRDLDKLNQLQVNALLQAVNAGSHVLILPEKSSVLSSKHQQIIPFSLPSIHQTQRPQHFSSDVIQSSLFMHFIQSSREALLQLQLLPIYQGRLKRDAYILAHYKDQTPAVIRQSIGLGTVTFVNALLSENQNILENSPLLLPILHELLLTAMNSDTTHQMPAYTYLVPIQMSDKPVNLIAYQSDGTPVSLQTTSSPEGTLISVPEDTPLGLITITHDDSRVMQFTTPYPEVESDFTVDEALLDSIMASLDIPSDTKQADLSHISLNTFKPVEKAMEFWPWLLMLSLPLLLIELFLANRDRAGRESGEDHQSLNVHIPVENHKKAPTRKRAA